MARLIDSSLWVDFTRPRTPVWLKQRIHPWILDPQAALCEPVAFEILQHATATEKPRIEAQFSALPLLSTPPNLWQRAAELGRKCRAIGVNPGSIDLLIATLAIHHAAEVISFDAGFSDIAKVAPLRTTILPRNAAD